MIVHFKSYFHDFNWDRIQSGMQWEALHWVFPVVTMVTQGFLRDSPVFPAGSSLMRCSHINLILSMFHQSGHIRFFIYVYLHTKQHFLIFYVFVAICFGSSPFFKQTAWTIPCVLTHTGGCCFAAGKKIQCNTCKHVSNDFASRSFVGWLSESPLPKYNVIMVLITQNWYITLSNLNVIHSLQQAYKHALFYPGLWSYQSSDHNLWSHLGTKLAKTFCMQIFFRWLSLLFCDLSKCFDPAYICCKVN